MSNTTNELINTTYDTNKKFKINDPLGLITENVSDEEMDKINKIRIEALERIVNKIMEKIKEELRNVNILMYNIVLEKNDDDTLAKYVGSKVIKTYKRKDVDFIKLSYQDDDPNID